MSFDRLKNLERK